MSEEELKTLATVSRSYTLQALSDAAELWKEKNQGYTFGGREYAAFDKASIVQMGVTGSIPYALTLMSKQWDNVVVALREHLVRQTISAEKLVEVIKERMPDVLIYSAIILGMIKEGEVDGTLYSV